MGETDHVEIVRGRIDEALAEELASHWASAGVSDPRAARRRAEETVCVLRDADGRVAGAGSAFVSTIPLIGNQVFWVYESAIPDPANYQPMLGACFEALAEEFASGGPTAVGLCVLTADRAVLERHREAVWPETGFLYAGFDPHGRQARVRYFEGARVYP